MKRLTMYICFEGIDGSGKSTLARGVYERLIAQNETVLLTKEPGSTLIGKEIRHIVQYAQEPLASRAEFLLYAADRAQHYATVIVPALQSGVTVLSDRGFASSFAYQGYGRGLDKDFITLVNQWAMQGVVPDIFIYLDITPEKAFERIHARDEKITRFEQEKISFFTRVVEGYEELFKKHTNVIKLDANQSQEELIEAVVTYVKSYEKK